MFPHLYLGQHVHLATVEECGVLLDLERDSYHFLDEQAHQLLTTVLAHPSDELSLPSGAAGFVDACLAEGLLSTTSPSEAPILQAKTTGSAFWLRWLRWPRRLACIREKGSASAGKKATESPQSLPMLADCARGPQLCAGRISSTSAVSMTIACCDRLHCNDFCVARGSAPGTSSVCASTPSRPMRGSSMTAHRSSTNCPLRRPIRAFLPADPNFSIAYRLADRRWELLRGRASTAAGLEVVGGGVVVNAPQLRHLFHLPLKAGVADLLAHAYGRWGTDLGVHVEGQFAAAVFAANTGTLALVQDYLGLFPLSYRIDGDILRVATDLVDIARADDELDATYAAIYLSNGIAEGPYTPFKRIRRLEPAQAAQCVNGRLAIRGLAPLVDDMPERNPDVPAKAEELRLLIEEAVRASTVGAARPGCEVSGGLDSASVATSAVKVSDRRPVAFRAR